MITYEIKYEPVEISGKTIDKYNIYYTGGDFDGVIEFHSTDGINGIVRDGYVNIHAPKWYDLQNGLYKSSLFTKYLNDYNTKGLIFQTTIQDGKDGRDVNEQTLLLGFQAMQINFTAEEMGVINQILKDNNFSIQLK